MPDKPATVTPIQKDTHFKHKFHPNGSVTIVKRCGRENRTITLTAKEFALIYEDETIRRQPWPPAS